MKAVYHTYLPDEEIPIHAFTRNQKLVKYYTRETMAAIVAVGELLGREESLSHDVSFFYSSGETELPSDYMTAFEKLRQMNGRFSSARYMEEVVPVISPIAQFKMMRNMTHCLVAIEYGLKGDNATLLCASAADLLQMATLANKSRPVLLGAGRLALDGRVETGFALLQPSEIDELSLPEKEEDEMLFFKNHS